MTKAGAVEGVDALKLHALILESMVEGVSVSDENGFILYTNPAEDAMFGYAPGELVGQHVTVQNTYPPEENARIVSDVIAQLHRNGYWSGEFSNRKKDGAPFVTAARITAVQLGARKCLVCVQQDVTERRRADAKLRDSEQRHRWIVENTTDAVWRFEVSEPVPMSWSAEAQIAAFYERGALSECNEAFARMYNAPSAADIVGLRLADAMPASEPRNVAYLRAFIRSGYRLTDAESVELAADGEVRHVLNNLVGYVENGCVLGAWGTSRDITQRKRDEEALRQAESRLRLAVESAELGTFDYDPRTGAIDWSDRCKALFGLPAGARVDYSTFVAGLHPEDREATARAVERALQPGTGDFQHEYRTIGIADRVERWIAAKGKAFFDDHGRAVRLIGTVLDVTERKRAEQGQKLLLDELNHRVKNTLATVQSIASQTLQTAPSLPAFRTAFDARLLALSQAHNLLTRTSWRGAGLRDIVTEKLAPYARAPDGNVVIEGEAVDVPAKLAVTLGLAFHELATNAAKYGALSTPSGSVRVSWFRREGADESTLAILWEERGGPPAKPPEHKGFGMKLIERGLAYEFQGSARFEYAPVGLRCTIELPLSPKHAEKI